MFHVSCLNSTSVILFNFRCIQICSSSADAGIYKSTSKSIWSTANEMELDYWVERVNDFDDRYVYVGVSHTINSITPCFRKEAISFLFFPSL